MTDTSDFTFYQRMALYATAACFADSVTFPLDLAKVRLQVQSNVKGTGLKYKSLLHTISTVAREEGPRALYKGLVPGLQRQMCFASVKFGLYDSVKDFYLGLLHAEEGSNMMVRVAAGMTTGFMAVFIAQPTDVVKIRFQASQGVADAHRTVAREYSKIMKQEGLAGLWKGAIAGLCATVIASPFDVIKTRYMSSSKGEYSSVLHVALETMKEGPLAFYKGFFPSFYRIATWNIVLWISFEQLKIMTRKIRRLIPARRN